MSGFLRDLTGKRSAGLVAPSDDPELAEWERVAAEGPVDYDFTEADRLADELRAVIGRHDPLPGDRVLWHDETWGVVAIVDAPWLEPGEAVVYRHEDQAHGGAPSWCVEAGSLVARYALPDGRQAFTYRGSLR